MTKLLHSRNFPKQEILLALMTLAVVAVQFAVPMDRRWCCPMVDGDAQLESLNSLGYIASVERRSLLRQVSRGSNIVKKLGRSYFRPRNDDQSMLMLFL